MNSTLPGSFYTLPENYAREIERFFVQGWVAVGREEQVREAGQHFVCDIAGESVIVTRDVAGQLRAHFNVCRHRGTRMCLESHGKFKNAITCPYHGWTYGLDGTLMSAPQMPAEFRRADYSLHSVAVTAWQGHLWVNLSGAAPPLELPSLFDNWRMQELVRRERIVYNVGCNWKLIISNYNECLHCPLVHPSLNRLTDYLGADNDVGSASCFGGDMGFRNDAQTMSETGRLTRAYLPGLDERERKLVRYYTLLPNLLLSLHPDYMMTHTLWPRGVDRTEVVCEWSFHPSERGDIRDAVDFWDRTNREDWEMCERSQLGISSRAYRPGAYSPREELLERFDRIVEG